MVDTGSGGLCRLMVAVLEVDGLIIRSSSADVGGCRPVRHPVADCEPSSTLRGPGVAVVELRFQCAPEGFRPGRCPSTPPLRPTDWRRMLVAAGEPGELPGGVLGASVGVKMTRPAAAARAW